MLMRVDCVVAALEGAFGAPLDELRAARRIVVLDPGGRPFDDAVAREYAAGPDLVLLAGRYEGFDHRVHDHVATEALSLGPFVLSGGEVAAMAVVDAVTRFLEGSLGDAASSEEESFSPALDGLVEYPHYTRPPSYRGWEVPEVLLSGHHGRIAAWRREQAEERTRRLREADAED
jgi:tRNA (guanine37-N1)-methyltransferase